MQSLLKSIRIALFLGIWIIWGGVYLPAALAKPSIAILELDAKGGITADEASIITDRLRAQLHQTGHFQILERAKMESVLKELGFQQSQFCDDSKCKAQIGKLLGVDGLVIGSVSRLDTIYTLSIRILNVEKGFIIREEFQDCECPLKDVLTKVTPSLVTRLFSQKTTHALPDPASPHSIPPQKSPSQPPPKSELEVQTLAGKSGWQIQNGLAAEATFQAPSALLWNAQGELLIADAQNHLIRKLSAQGEVSIQSGAEHGFGNVINFADGRAEKARYNYPSSMALHFSGHVYIADTDNHRIRIMTPEGHVSTFVGTGTPGLTDGNAAVAQFYRPRGLAFDTQGNLYVADTGNHCIRKITPNGMVSTLAGNGQLGFVNGQGANAQFSYPTALVFHQNTLYIADTFNHSIRTSTLTGEVSTLAGMGEAGFSDGPAARARFNAPRGLAFGPDHQLYIADTDNHRIRKYTSDQKVVTVVGNGSANFADGSIAVAQFNQPIGLLFNPEGHLLVADSGNNRIRRIIFF